MRGYFTRLNRKKVIEAYAQPGATMDSVGKQFGCSRMTICRIIRAAGRGDLSVAKRGGVRGTRRRGYDPDLLRGWLMVGVVRPPL